jgi:hypothetical protein
MTNPNHFSEFLRDRDIEMRAEKGSDRELLLQILLISLSTNTAVQQLQTEVSRMASNDAALSSAVTSLTTAVTNMSTAVAALPAEIAAIEAANNASASPDPAITDAVANINTLIASLNTSTAAVQAAGAAPAAPVPATPAAPASLTRRRAVGSRPAARHLVSPSCNRTHVNPHRSWRQDGKHQRSEEEPQEKGTGAAGDEDRQGKHG